MMYNLEELTYGYRYRPSITRLQQIIANESPVADVWSPFGVLLGLKYCRLCCTNPETTKVRDPAYDE
jgi:hypothetical protein